MLNKIVMCALTYQASKMYHEEHPGDYSALCAEDLNLELLKKAIAEYNRGDTK